MSDDLTTRPTLDTVLERVNALGEDVRQGFTTITARLDRMDERLDNMDTRLDRTQAMVHEMRADFRELRGQFKQPT